MSDFENMIDEELIEYDFYIDKPADAIFIPNKEGEDK